MATHSLLKRRTALKFLRPEIAGKETLERFEQEVRLAASLTHPNNISIYDYGYGADGVFYYAMELLNGATLREIVERTGPLPVGRAIHALAQCCGALKEAHDKGILHRDIKAANIMLCEQGGEHDFVKVLDFGLAKRIDRASGLAHSDGKVAGSLETLSPEALRGRDLSPASDLYSLSVVAYFLVSGRHLYDVTSGQEMIQHHLSIESIPPSRHNPQIAKDLEVVILQGLSKDPDERMADAEAFRQALLQCEDAGRWDQDQARSWWEDYERSRPQMTPESETSSSSIDTRVRSEISDSSLETRIMDEK